MGEEKRADQNHIPFPPIQMMCNGCVTSEAGTKERQNQPGIQNKTVNVDENIYIPVTKAELTLLVSAFTFIFPYLLGWHAYADTIRLEDGQRTNDANPRYGGGFEWVRS